MSKKKLIIIIIPITLLISAGACLYSLGIRPNFLFCKMFGKYEVYDAMTEVGTDAMCEYVNKLDRVTKREYYSHGGLFVQSTHVFQFDDQNRVTKQVITDNTTFNKSQFKYKTVDYLDNGIQRENYFSESNIKIFEYWITGKKDFRSSPRTEVLFDITGEYPIATKGAENSMIVISNQWGESVDGIQCKGMPNMPKGNLDQFIFYGTILNKTGKDLSYSADDKNLDIEIVDAEGNLITDKKEFTGAYPQALMYNNETSFWGGEISLTNVIDHLPKGEFTITLKRKMPETEKIIICSSFKIEVI